MLRWIMGSDTFLEMPPLILEGRVAIHVALEHGFCLWRTCATKKCLKPSQSRPTFQTEIFSQLKNFDTVLNHRSPDKYFQMITDRSWESILVLIREVDSEVAGEVLSRIHSGTRGGNNNPQGLGFPGVSRRQVNGDNVTMTSDSDSLKPSQSRPTFQTYVRYACA